MEMEMEAPKSQVLFKTNESMALPLGMLEILPTGHDLEDTSIFLLYNFNYYLLRVKVKIRTIVRICKGKNWSSDNIKAIRSHILPSSNTALVSSPYIDCISDIRAISCHIGDNIKEALSLKPLRSVRQANRPRPYILRDIFT
ncbi:hypothetical protein M8J75_016183 [Diaphorina citri]|nr:hypothetical protein M8J75_016183 [Diaphorina citri]